MVVEWDEYRNVFCMQHAELKICRPVKIELEQRINNIVRDRTRKKKGSVSRFACIYSHPSPLEGGLEFVVHESSRPIMWIYLDAQMLKLCRLVLLSLVCIDACLSLDRSSTSGAWFSCWMAINFILLSSLSVFPSLPS